VLSLSSRCAETVVPFRFRHIVKMCCNDCKELLLVSERIAFARRPRDWLNTCSPGRQHCVCNSSPALLECPHTPLQCFMGRKSEANAPKITCPACNLDYSKGRIKGRVCNPEKASRKLQRLAQQGGRPVMLLLDISCQAIAGLKHVCLLQALLG